MQKARRTTPSVVAFGKDNERLVGQPARGKRLQMLNILFSVKSLIGRR